MRCEYHVQYAIDIELATTQLTLQVLSIDLSPPPQIQLHYQQAQL